ncbi:MAG: hypothetical protein EBZ69_10535, partial [Alphaproteobacteria bacterium]|nr:hypothetical protein [Alphaproteobacteria bacterium]
MPTLQQLADKTGATLSGNGARVVGRLCHPLDWQHETDLVLAMDKDLAAQLPKVSGLMAVLAHPGSSSRHAAAS